MTPNAVRGRLLRAMVVAATAAVVAGCGGGSGSSTGPSSTSNTLRRLEVQVDRDRAAGAPRSLVVRLADLLGWPQVAEASHCQITAGAPPHVVQGFTGPDEKAVLPGVGVDPLGQIPVSIACSDGTGGTLTLTGGVPGAIVSIRVRVRPDRIEVRAKDVRVSAPSLPSRPSVPSKPSKPSKPSSPSSGRS